MPRGGKRPGAGRPKKDRTPEGVFDTAQEYLEAVVSGKIAPDAARISAARILIQYERAKQRAPVKSPPRGQLQTREKKAVEQAVSAEFERRAAEIREELSKKRGEK
jgi:glycine cleavage system H lipoate-binding protein